MVANMSNHGADPHGGGVSYLTGANVSGTPGKRYNAISCDRLQETPWTKTRFPTLTLSAKEPDGGQEFGPKGFLSLGMTLVSNQA